MRETIGHGGRVSFRPGGAAKLGGLSRTWACAGALALVCLACVLLAARPAHAQETWYGTVQFSSDGVPVTRDYGDYKTVTTEKHYISYEAPLSVDRATVSGRYYQHIKYEYPSLNPQTPGCYPTSEEHVGTWQNTGYIAVNIPSYIDAYPVQPKTFTVVSTTRMAGTDAWGDPCTDVQGTGLYDYQFLSIEQPISPVGSCKKECVSSDLPLLKNGLNARWSLSSTPFGTYANVYNIGNNDKVSVFTVAQTQSLNSRISAFDDNYGKPAVCDWSFVKRLSKICTAYKAITQVDWAATRWFMYHATLRQACGVWVEDGASWRPPKIRPAIDPQSGSKVAWIAPGETQLIKTATGTMTLKCPG